MGSSSFYFLSQAEHQPARELYFIFRRVYWKVPACGLQETEKIEGEEKIHEETERDFLYGDSSGIDDFLRQCKGSGQ